MLTDNKKWIMSLPSKCGSSRFYYMQEKYPKFAKRLGDWHGGDGTGDHEENLKRFKTRLLLLRDPLNRMVSTFWFMLTQEPGKSKRFDWWQKQDFNAFSEWVLDHRANAERRLAMLRPLRKYYNHFKPTHLILLEEVDNIWPFVGHQWMEIYYSTRKRATTRRKSVKETVRKKLVPRFKDWLLEDYHTLDVYEIPKEVR